MLQTSRVTQTTRRDGRSGSIICLVFYVFAPCFMCHLTVVSFVSRAWCIFRNLCGCCRDMAETVVARYMALWVDISGKLRDLCNYFKPTIINIAKSGTFTSHMVFSHSNLARFCVTTTTMCWCSRVELSQSSCNCVVISFRNRHAIRMHATRLIRNAPLSLSLLSFVYKIATICGGGGPVR